MHMYLVSLGGRWGELGKHGAFKYFLMCLNNCTLYYDF
jgi:hypothetical protein